MADRQDCAHYADCPYREEFGICPAYCFRFKHRDEVLVVRCKDCRYMEMTPAGLRRCAVWNGFNGMGDEGFCNYGERSCDG